MQLKKGLQNATSDFWYDLTDGGYLKPEKMCESKEDAERVNAAIDTIKTFQKSCEEQIENFIM